jgi:hypothetical protein
MMLVDDENKDKMRRAAKIYVQGDPIMTPFIQNTYGERVSRTDDAMVVMNLALFSFFCCFERFYLVFISYR